MDEVDPLDGDVPEADHVRAVATTVVIRLLTEWSTDDPGLAATLRAIQALPEHEPERHDAEAFLHMIQARAAWRKADELRAHAESNRRRTERIAAGRANDGRRVVRHGTCQMCDTRVRLRVDGTVRVHDVGSGAAQSRAVAGAANRCAGAGLPPKA